VSVAAILLAAGASRRMGQSKPLLPWGDRSLIAWELDQLIQSCVDEIVIVTGARADAVRRSLGPAGQRYCVFNPRWAQGRSGSLATGVNALLTHDHAAIDAVVIQNVDQPTRADIIDGLVDELRRAHVDAIQPEHEGHGGHPVVVSAALLRDLAAVREETLGLRGVLEQHPAYRVPIADPVVLLDLDTPDTLAEGRRLLGVAEA
jgi:molybdenum cofactor cytidylyltransferase